MQIYGYLFHYQELTPQHFREGILNRILAHMDSREDKASGDPLGCYLRFSQCENLPDDVRARVKETIECMIPSSVETDSTKWEGYCLKPIEVIKSPDSPFLHLIDQALETSLDYEINNQDDDGSWKPFWSWGDAYPDDWKIAKQEWRAILTLDVLRVLKAFGRIGT